MGNTMESKRNNALTPADFLPDGPLDILARDVADLKRSVIAMTKRHQELDATILKILQTFKRGEESFDVRVARVLRNVMSGMVHELDHSIESTANAIAQLERGFDVYPVDGKTVLENERTILVTRTEDGGYNYALARDPENIMNEGCDPFSEFFNKNPEIFGDKKELLVNIIAYTTKPQPEQEQEDAKG